MIFERTDRLRADQMPYERQRMFRDTHHFAFTAAPSPCMTTERAELADVRLFRIRSTGHSIRLTDRDYTTFLLPRRGTIAVRTRRGTHVARPGDAMLFAPNERDTTVAPDRSGAFACDCLLVPTAVAAPPDAPGSSRLLPHSHEQICSGGPDSALRNYLSFLCDEGSRPNSYLASPKVRGAAGVLLQELLAELIDRLAGTGDSRRPASAQEIRLVRSAEDLMLACFDEPVSVGALAGRLGVSVRKLQYAFQSVRDATPRMVLSRFRIEAARHCLSDPSETRTVTEIALDCGVAHFGRFASTYATRYAESPSETLRRARRR